MNEQRASSKQANKQSWTVPLPQSWKELKIFTFRCSSVFYHTLYNMEISLLLKTPCTGVCTYMYTVGQVSEIRKWQMDVALQLKHTRIKQPWTKEFIFHRTLSWSLHRLDAQEMNHSFSSCIEKLERYLVNEETWIEWMISPLGTVKSWLWINLQK